VQRRYLRPLDLVTTQVPQSNHLASTTTDTLALNSLYCADVPSSNYSLTHSLTFDARLCLSKEYNTFIRHNQVMALSVLAHCTYSHTFSTRAAASSLSDRGLERGSSCNSSSVDLLPGSALMPCNHRDRLHFAHSLRAEWPIRVSTLNVYITALLCSAYTERACYYWLAESCGKSWEVNLQMSI